MFQTSFYDSSCALQALFVKTGNNCWARDDRFRSRLFEYKCDAKLSLFHIAAKALRRNPIVLSYSGFASVRRPRSRAYHRLKVKQHFEFLPTCLASPPHPAHLTAAITPPARIKPRLGQKVHIAKIPRPTGFGFGSLVQPKAANRIVKSSGPVPSTNIVTPPPISMRGNRNRARVLAAGLGALTPKSGGR